MQFCIKKTQTLKRQICTHGKKLSVIYIKCHFWKDTGIIQSDFAGRFPAIHTCTQFLPLVSEKDNFKQLEDPKF